MRRMSKCDMFVALLRQEYKKFLKEEGIVTKDDIIHDFLKENT